MISTSFRQPSPPSSSFFFSDRPILSPPSFIKLQQKSTSFSDAFATTCTITSAPSVSTSPAGSFYETLGISMNATSEEIKAAYRRLARVYHPDVAAKDMSADEFMKIHAAYCTLSDHEKRADYDRRINYDRRVFRSRQSSIVSPYSNRYTFRNWETDQCW